MMQSYENEHLWRMVGAVENLMYGVRATGGYKVRKHIPMPDKDIQKFISGAEINIYELVVALVVAEATLDAECKTGRYKQRLDEVRSEVIPLIKARVTARLVGDGVIS